MQLTDRDPSIFVYAVADYPLGGPPFFFVTGFAAGFGYNRALNLPPIDQVLTFPLVAEAVKDGGPKSLPASQKEQQETLTGKLQQLEQFLPPSVGEIFIAAGIKFNSFKQIDSFALLAVKFGRRFEIDLLGYSTLTAPAPVPDQKDAPVAQAQLALKASFIPDEGCLEVRAQLTPNSYIFSKDCHLTGGFAFYSWFEPHPHAGDFVLTLGGYHPKFTVPEHYPKVPRLAVNWQVSTELQVKADAYFALTGSALMAGGHLQVTWQHEKLRAWLNAGADFILAWQPYHYDAILYVDIGVSYTFEGFGSHTLTVDLGADLHLWGPEFCGEATVHLSIISFTIRFGQDTPKELEPIGWETFKAAFLPKPEQICSISVQQGLIRQMPAEGDQVGRWIVNAKEMVLVINSLVPINKTPMREPYLKLADQYEAYDLRIIPIAKISDINIEGHKLIIVAFVDSVLHIRIFGSNRNRVFNKTEKDIVDNDILKALKDRLNSVPDISSLEEEVKKKIIEDVTYILVDEKANHLAIAPVGIESNKSNNNLTSTFSIRITRGEQSLENDTFQLSPIWKSMPAGLWGEPNLTDDRKHLKPPNLNGPQLIENMLVGFEIRPNKKAQQPNSKEVNRSDLKYPVEQGPKIYPWQDFELPGLYGETAWNKARDTVVGMDKERIKLFEALGLVNPVVDFGEPVKQGVLLPA